LPVLNWTSMNQWSGAYTRKVKSHTRDASLATYVAKSQRNASAGIYGHPKEISRVEQLQMLVRHGVKEGAVTAYTIPFLAM
jgi:hypothetical protein